MSTQPIQFAILVPQIVADDIRAVVEREPAVDDIANKAAGATDAVLGFDPDSVRNLVWLVLTFAAGTSLSIIENLIASAIYDRLGAGSKGSFEVSVRLVDGRLFRLRGDDPKTIEVFVRALRTASSLDGER